MYIEGYADLDSTNKYFAKRGISDSRLKKTQWFSTLPIAIGTHLGDFSDEHSELSKAAIKLALEKGINFIDTAINYRGMRAERDIGECLRQLINEKEQIKRSEIIISTKTGILPGDITLNMNSNLYLQEVLLKEGAIEEHEINRIDYHKHTLSPKYFEWSINKARQHMGIETIDIHYVHNPEFSMMVLGEERFYKSLIKLFEFYEGQVEAGSIRSYGVATWDALLIDDGEPGYISLERTVEAAKAAAGNKNNFKFIMLPFNLKNNEAATKRNQTVGRKLLSALEAAQELEIYTTISAPLVQGECFAEASPEKMLRYVTDSDSVFAAMVGMKQAMHVEENLKIYI